MRLLTNADQDGAHRFGLLRLIRNEVHLVWLAPDCSVVDPELRVDHDGPVLVPGLTLRKARKT
jgi:hypothetical protein